MRDRVDILQGDHAVGEQSEGPASGTVRWGATGQGDQVGFPNAIEGTVVLASRGFPLQRGVHPLLHGCLANPRHRHHPHIQCRVNHGSRSSGFITSVGLL